jgi:hypothetical protein
VLAHPHNLLLKNWRGQHENMLTAVIAAPLRQLVRLVFIGFAILTIKTWPKGIPALRVTDDKL